MTYRGSKEDVYLYYSVFRIAKRTEHFITTETRIEVKQRSGRGEFLLGLLGKRVWKSTNCVRD